MSDYLPILVMLVLGTGFAGVSFIASTLLAPSRPTAAKLAPYECGIVPEYDVPQRFSVKFSLVAMIFVVFDIEIVFLYPFAVIFRQLALFGLAEMGIFLLTVLVAYAYVLSSGALEWGPAKQRAGQVTRPVLRTSDVHAAIAADAARVRKAS